MPTQLDYVCLRTLNPLEVDFFNLYFGPEKLERMVGSTKAYVEDHFDNGTYSRYAFIVGEFPSPGLTAGRTDRPFVRPCIVSGRVGE